MYQLASQKNSPLVFSVLFVIVIFCQLSSVHLLWLPQSSISSTQTDAQNPRPLGTIRAAPSTELDQKRWPNNTVYYELDNVFDPTIKESLRKAMSEIENVSCIRYIPRTNQLDYVRFENNETGCREPVGRLGGEQKTFIKVRECGFYGFFIHAAMQVLGFYHEHQRFDRDEHITINLDNIQPEWLWAFEKLNSTNHFYDSPYDTDSIMHYGSFQFSKNGQPTIVTKDGKLIQSWEEKKQLSLLDKIALNDYYKCNEY